MQVKNGLSLISFSERFLPYLLLLISATWVWILFSSGTEITGPFIFNDEPLYFNFSRSIFHAIGLESFTQFGPLYPALISPAFSADNAVTTYLLVKVLNIIFFISSVIPAYLLSKCLFTNLWLRWLLPFSVIFTPFSSFVYLVWAEPLYITLFYWSALFLYLFAKKPSLIKSFLLGMFISSLYYTKTGSGLISEIAFTLAIGVYLLNDVRSKNAWLSLLSIVVCALFTLPWIIHYKHLGLSIIGYPTATVALSTQLKEIGVFTLSYKMLVSFFYQLSYVIISSYAMIGIGVTLLIIHWKKIDVAARTLMFFVILCASGVMALSALGMVTIPGLDYHMPNGRYTSFMLPLIIILTLNFLFQLKTENIYLIMALIFTAIVAYVATPLYTRNPFSFNTMPDLSSIMYFSDAGKFIWRSSVERPSNALRLNVVLFFSSIAFLIIVFCKYRFSTALTTLFISICVLFTGLSERYYMHGLAIGQSSINNIYIYLIKNSIPASQLGFDSDLKEGNVQFLTPFWTDSTSQFIDAKNVTSKYFVSQKDLVLKKLYISDNYKVYERG